MKANASWKKLGGNKKLKTGGIFLVANFLETHNTECDNSAYNSLFFSARFARKLLLASTFKAAFKGKG